MVNKSLHNADPALYDAFWLDRERQGASLQLQPRSAKQCSSLGGVWAL